MQYMYIQILIDIEGALFWWVVFFGLSVPLWGTLTESLSTITAARTQRNAQWKSEKKELDHQIDILCSFYKLDP